jgi:hypothetical protein
MVFRFKLGNFSPFPLGAAFDQDLGKTLTACFWGHFVRLVLGGFGLQFRAFQDHAQSLLAGGSGREYHWPGTSANGCITGGHLPSEVCGDCVVQSYNGKPDFLFGRSRA